MIMERLTRKLLPSIQTKDLVIGPREEYPVKVMQFGEGNFLRAFIDWMIDKSNEAGRFGGMVQLVQPLPQGMADFINEQDGLYTLILRGMENGAPAEYKRVVTCVKGCLKTDSEWDKVVECACLPSLELVFSNTTEAGIEYRPEAYTPGKAQQTYPAKLASLLYERFKAGRKGLVIVPCELIDKNGAKLRECILHYAADWKLGGGFVKYVENECAFLNTLFDRIVAGYPRAEAAAYCEKLGYEDKLLDCGELFHLFVIEGDEKFRKVIPFAEAGLNLVWTSNQTPYRSRKVRFLNGGHTSSVLAAYLAGFDFVDKMTADPLFGRYLRTALFDEVFPTVQLPDGEKKAFAESIIDRFLNPFANHQLISISLNSISKWQVRVLPSLLDYVELKGRLPKVLTFSFAALLAFYRGTKNADGKWIGKRAAGSYPISDDDAKITTINAAYAELDRSGDYRSFIETIASKTDFWGRDLNQVPGFTDAAAAYLKSIEDDGVAAAVRKLLEA